MSGYLNILNYLNWISERFGYHVALKDFAGFLTKAISLNETFRPYYIHRNAFCMYIKQNDDVWDSCQLASKRLRKKCLNAETPFVGMCYCGYSELIYPIRHGDRTIGAICVGGFELSEKKSKRRRDKIIKDYNLDPEKTEEKYREAAGAEILNQQDVLTMCEMIAKYFSLYYSLLLETRVLLPNAVFPGDTTRWYLLSHAEEYIRQNYMNEIQVSDIAAFCRCSESYISHIFKKVIHISVNRYINQMRIEKAKEYIKEGDVKFHQIASLCGFSDPNYFSYVFKNIARVTPSQYRAEVLRGEPPK